MAPSGGAVSGGRGWPPQLLEAALAEVGDEDTVERCRLLSRLANTLHARGEVGRGGDLSRQAAVLARRLDDGASLIDALSCELFQVGGRPLPKARFAERRHTLDELNQLFDDLSYCAPSALPRPDAFRVSRDRRT